jgi:hypothetical protein
LRERREDIPALAHHFVQHFATEVKRSLSGISDEALGRLSAYEWPGNIRELANAIERAVVLAQGPEIAAHDLPARIVAAQPESRSERASYRESMDAYRRQLVMRALAQSRGNRAAAARALGLHEKYLLRLLKNLGIQLVGGWGRQRARAIPVTRPLRPPRHEPRRGARHPRRYGLIESAKLHGVEPKAHRLHAVRAVSNTSRDGCTMRWRTRRPVRRSLR